MIQPYQRSSHKTYLFDLDKIYTPKQKFDIYEHISNKLNTLYYSGYLSDLKQTHKDKEIIKFNPFINKIIVKKDDSHLINTYIENINEKNYPKLETLLTNLDPNTEILFHDYQDYTLQTNLSDKKLQKYKQEQIVEIAYEDEIDLWEIWTKTAYNNFWAIQDSSLYIK